MANFIMRPMELPAPPPKYPQVEYNMESAGRWIAIDWHGGSSKQWTAIKEAIKALPQRRYNGQTKKWLVPATEAMIQWLKLGGWGAEEDDGESKFKLPDPVIAPPLDQTRVLDKLYPYQVQFLRFSQGKPRLCLWDGMGCIAGTASVQVHRHGSTKTVTLAEFYKMFCRAKSLADPRAHFTLRERPWFIRCLHQDSMFRLGEVIDVVESGVKDLVRITLEDGRTLDLTPDHEIKTESGWVEAKDSLGIAVACNGTPGCLRCGSVDNLITSPQRKFVGYCRACAYKLRDSGAYRDNELHETVGRDGYVRLRGKPMHGYKGYTRTDGVPKHRYVMEQHLGRFLKPGEVVHHIDGNKLNNDISNLMLLKDDRAHRVFHRSYHHFKFVNVQYLKVTSVEPIAAAMTYDVKVLNHGNFLANKVVVHNCGKTLQALAWIRYQRVDPVLIICNSATKLQWKSNWGQWLSEAWPHEVKVLSGKTPYRLEAGMSYIINWDILTYWQDALVNHKFRGVVADEAQAVGERTSKRTQAFMEIAKSAPLLLAMSGTPARSRPVQLWPVLNCINPKVFENFFDFAEYFGAPKETPFGRVYSGITHAKQLHAELQKIAIRRLKEDVLKDLPKKTRSFVPMEVDASLMTAYEADEESLSGDEEGVSLEAKLASLTRSAYNAKESSVKLWLQEFLESGEKLVVFAWHRAVVEDLMEFLNQWCPVCLYGGMTEKAREMAKEQFVTMDCCKVLVANIQSGGVGIDGLQKVCSSCCFVECSVTPADHDQAEDRLCRIGQELPVTCYYLIAEGTVDEDLVAILDRKANTLSKVIDGHKADPSMLLRNIMSRRGV